MTIRDHRNPYLRIRKEQDRQRRANARKEKRANPHDYVAVRARLARDLCRALWFI